MAKKNENKGLKVRLAVIIIISLAVIVTGVLFSLQSFMNGNVGGGILGAIIAIVILCFAYFIYHRGTRDLREGYPLKDERSRRVIERATYMAFLISLYVLLTIGWLSDGILKFRDVSQAMSVSVGIMAILFAVFWVYYNRKGV